MVTSASAVITTAATATTGAVATTTTTTATATATVVAVVILVHRVRRCPIRIRGVRTCLHLIATILCLRLRHHAVLRLVRLTDIHTDSDPVLTSRRSSATSVLPHRIATSVLVSTGTASVATATAVLTRLVRLSARVDVGNLTVVTVEVILVSRRILTRILTNDAGARVLTIRRTSVLIPLTATINRLSLRLIGQIRLRGW